MNYPPTQPLASEEQDLIWKFRFYLTREKRALTKLIKSVTWRDPSEVKQAVEVLLPQWTDIDTDDALELLGPGTPDSRVRAFAVKQLHRADDDVSICDSIFKEEMAQSRSQELLLYLLQLLQALKFEGSVDGQRTVRLSSATISTEDSGLADFLIDRSVCNPVLGNRFHWYLMVEVALEDKTTAKVFGKVWFKFMEKLKKVGWASNTHIRVTALTGTSSQKTAQGGQRSYGARMSSSLHFSREPKTSKRQRSRDQRKSNGCKIF